LEERAAVAEEDQQEDQAAADQDQTQVMLTEHQETLTRVAAAVELIRTMKLEQAEPVDLEY
jgi:hypothetical protein